MITTQAELLSHPPINGAHTWLAVGIPTDRGVFHIQSNRGLTDAGRFRFIISADLASVKAFCGGRHVSSIHFVGPMPGDQSKRRVMGNVAKIDAAPKGGDDWDILVTLDTGEQFPPANSLASVSFRRPRALLRRRGGYFLLGVTFGGFQ